MWNRREVSSDKVNLMLKTLNSKQTLALIEVLEATDWAMMA
ncbi:MAG: hypothetical protein ACR5K4_01350 [Sodalis sp. (in: enterobacteria)]